MANYAKGNVELILKLKNFRQAQAAIKKVAGYLATRLPKGAAKGSAKAARVVKKALFGALLHQTTNFGRTMFSAMYRTMAYGLINVIRQSVQKTIQIFKEGAQKSMDIARAAVIASGEDEDANKTYEGMVENLIDTKKAAALTTTQMIEASKALSKAGLSAEEQKYALEQLNRAFVITGEKADKMALPYVKMIEAFKVGKEEYKMLMDKLIVGSTSAAGTIGDLLQATKHLGPVMSVAFGDSEDSLDNFISTIMGMTAIGPGGGQASRWLLRTIQELVAPTSRSTRELQKFNIEVFEGGGASAKFKTELDASTKRVRNLHSELDKINKTIRRQRGAGKDFEALADEEARRAEIQAEINKETEIGERILDDYRKAGGKIKPLKDIMQEFKDMIEEGKISSQEFLNIVRKIFQIRGGKGVTAGMRQANKAQEIYNKLQKAGLLADKKYQDAMKQWGPILRTVVVAIDKIQTAITEIFGPGILGPIASMLKESVFDPISEALLDDSQWKVLRDAIKTKVEKALGPLKPELAKFFELLFNPENFGLDMGTEEYFQAVGGQIGKLYEKYIKPNVIEPMWDLFKEGGKVAAQGFIQAFGAEFDRGLAKIPLIGRLYSQKGQREAHAQKAWGKEEQSMLSEGANLSFFGDKPVLDERWQKLYQYVNKGIREGMDPEIVKLGEYIKNLGLELTKKRGDFRESEEGRERRYPDLTRTPQAEAERESDNDAAKLREAGQSVKESNEKAKQALDEYLPELKRGEGIIQVAGEKIKISAEDNNDKLSEFAFVVGDAIHQNFEQAWKAAQETGEKIEVIGHDTITAFQSIGDNTVRIFEYLNQRIKHQDKQLSNLRSRLGAISRSMSK